VFPEYIIIKTTFMHGFNKNYWKTGFPENISHKITGIVLFTSPMPILTFRSNFLLAGFGF